MPQARDVACSPLDSLALVSPHAARWLSPLPTARRHVARRRLVAAAARDRRDARADEPRPRRARHLRHGRRTAPWLRSAGAEVMFIDCCSSPHAARDCAAALGRCTEATGQPPTSSANCLAVSGRQGPREGRGSHESMQMFTCRAGSLARRRTLSSSTCP